VADRCENCGSTDLSDPGNALCALCWAAEHTPDAWDATRASAITGSWGAYSYLDDEDEAVL
jgi:hypothetical protein